MKRAVLSAIALVVVCMVVAAPVLWWDSAPSSKALAHEPTRITDYDAEFSVDDHGMLTATERITVAFPQGIDRHGIFRFWDAVDPNAPFERRDPQDVTVLLDGRPEPFTIEDRSSGRYDVARIGRPDVVLPPGEHTYEIRYRIDDVLLPVSDDSSRFYWDVIPGGWAQEIDGGTITVSLPAAADGVRCAVGWGGDTGCTGEGEGTRTLTIDVPAMTANSPLTVSAELAQPAPEAERDRLWTPAWDRVLGPSTAELVIVLGFAVAAGAASLLFVRRTHERPPPFPLVHAPPPGIGPAQAVYVLDEEIDPRRVFVASLLHLAQQGVVVLDRTGGGSSAPWRMSAPGGKDAFAAVDPVTRSMAEKLAVHREPFVARKTTTAGSMLNSAVSGLLGDVRAWARDERLVVPVTHHGWGITWVVLSGLATIGLVLASAGTGMSALALVPGAWAAMGLGWLASGSGTRRTAAGRELWSQVGGFRRVLATPSGRDRFDFSGREELYTAYIPWAVAFGVADEWAKKYRTEMGVDPPAPAWIGVPYSGSSPAAHVSSMISSFDSGVDAAISTYTTHLSSSSSSGSGSGWSSSSGSSGGSFSGGGGGGGGGGGSW